ncbi:MAG: DUF2459 domain-containing protein [Rhodobacteraceae bacterium]|jgi:uncharacterized protein (TIGR02117 family)|nr:DUF2459 domain-containing protein [Paracoccaceae bacterium]
MIARLLRSALRAAALLAAVILGYLFAAGVGGLWGNGNRATDGEYRIGLVIGPIHTDLLIPLTPAVKTRLAFAIPDGVPLDAPGAEWLLLGWGAREFYTTAGTYADITARATFRAITGDSAVIRLDAIGRINDFTDIPLIAMDAVQFAALLDVLAASFAPGPDGVPVAIDHAGFTASDRFYPATGHFNILTTCNVWVGDVLGAAGVPFGRWTPTPQAMQLSLWRLHGEG